MTKTLVLEKYTPPHGPITTCPTCGGPLEHPARVHIQGWFETKTGRLTRGEKEFGAGETGLIMAGHAADAARAKGVAVQYRGRWTGRQKHGPWDVNKAMRRE